MKLPRVIAGTLLGLALAGASVTGAVAAPAHPDQQAPSGYSWAAHTTSLKPTPAFSCSVKWKQGVDYKGLTAGYSWAWNKTLSMGATGNRVKEIQCLVEYWGFSPGGFDGVYGKGTKAAVKIFQAYHCSKSAADGIVGPKTWRCLRGNPNRH